KWRTKDCNSEVADAGSPGPAAYNSTDADVYKKRAPARTFGLPLKRANAVCTDTPHAYLIVSADGCINRCQPKRFTFGARRPQKHPPYVVPADNYCPP
ncbi:outer dense fiber protein 3-like, partial [Aphis craccivora]